MNPVPLWLYLVSVFGVSLISLAGVVLSNRNLAAQTDKQLTYQREQGEANRKHDHERWVVEQRLLEYGNVLTATDPLVNLARLAKRDPNFRLNLSGLQTNLMRYYLWATPEMRVEHQALMGACQLLSEAYLNFVQNRDDVAAQKTLDDAQRNFNVTRANFTTVTRKALGVDMA